MDKSQFTFFDHQTVVREGEGGQQINRVCSSVDFLGFFSRLWSAKIISADAWILFGLGQYLHVDWISQSDLIIKGFKNQISRLTFHKSRQK